MSFDLQVSNGDLVIKNGDLSQVQGQDKLVQDILKICLTAMGSNPLNPWYGSLISKNLIGSILPHHMTITMAQSQLQNSIETLKKIQNLQVASGQKVSPDEQIAAIVGILVNRNISDPRLYEVQIKVLNRALSKVSANFTVSNF